MDPVTSGLDPTVPLETFANTSIPTGGDSRLYNLNVFYNVSFIASSGNLPIKKKNPRQKLGGGSPSSSFWLWKEKDAGLIQSVNYCRPAISHG